MDATPEERTEWVKSMKEKLKKASNYAKARPWEKWCIYRVPRRLKDVHVDSKAYIPQTVSIGPYHNGVEQISDMECQKWVALHQILERTGQDLNLYLDSIKEVEDQARACYQQDVGHLSSNKFVEMMVLDGCFVLELFRCSPKAVLWSNPVDSPVFFNHRTVDDILLDIIMLENQIPLFILDRLLGLIYMAGNCGGQQKEEATSLALNLFNPEWLTGKPLATRGLNELKSSLQQKECLHILDVFRRSLLHAWPQPGPTDGQSLWWKIPDKLVPGCLSQWLHAKRTPNRMSMHGQVIHNVTELREAGVKFRKRDTNFFWDVKFKNGVLEIPSIWIQDGTMSILLNVAAFEHCHMHIRDAVVASYVVFMECLIKSPEDVRYLHRRGIIQHLLGHDAEVVDMFKSISKEMLVDAHDGYYAKLSEQVNAYYNQRRHKWRASLVHTYLNNPWAIVSVAAAVILLLLTTIQSFYAVYSYYKQNSESNEKKLS